MLLLFGSLLIFLLMSIPIGISVILSALLTIMSTQVVDIGFVTRYMVTSFDSFPILAIPLFMVAGEIMSRGGITERLFDLARIVVGRFTGGIPMAVVASCLMFGALSGASTASVAALGIITIPAMVSMGYDKVFATSLVAAASSLSVIMPPSMPMIMYGVSAGQSIGSLFLAGIVPAILITVLLMTYCNVYCRVKGLTNDTLKITAIAKPRVVIKRSILALFMPLIILGGIYGGIFTPTEAAGAAVLYSIIISMFVYKTITKEDLLDCFYRASKMIGPVMLIFGAATIFSKIVVGLQIPSIIANGLISISTNPLVILLLINILLLVVGVFMEMLSSILILTPILLPVAIQMGIDPIHFGIIMIVNMAIGNITPPMAMNLFVASSITGVSVEKISKGIIIPFFVLIVGLILITYIPALSMVFTGGV